MSDASSTRLAVEAVSAGADAIARFAKAATPSAASRRLTLADHRLVIESLHMTIRMVSHSLVREANSVRFRYGEHGEDGRGADLQRTLILAGQHAYDATSAYEGAGDALKADLQSITGPQALETRRTATLRSAAASAWPAAQDMGRALDAGNGYGIRLAGHAQIADLLSHIVSDLVTLSGYEAALIDGCYEDLRMGRAAGRVSGPVVKGGFDLRRTNRSLAVASVVLRDDASAGIGRRSA